MKIQIIIAVIWTLFISNHASSMTTFSMNIYKDLAKLYASSDETITFTDDKELPEIFCVINMYNRQEIRDFDFPNSFGVYNVSSRQCTHGNEYILIIIDGEVHIYRQTTTDQIWAIRRLLMIKENDPNQFEHISLETIIKNIIKPPHFRRTDEESEKIGMLHLHFHRQQCGDQ